MPPIVAITLPFFALVALGWFASHRRWLPESAVPGLNAYVLYFALPAMLFASGRALPLRALLDPVVLTVYLAVALIVVAAAYALARRRVPRADAAFGALVAAFPNTGFMGVPLLVALLGPAAAGPVITSMLADMVVTSTLCIVLARGGPRHGADADTAGDATAERTSAWATARQALARAAGNPLPWSIAAGGLASATGLVLPAPVERIVTMLAQSASPVALFTIGAVLWRAGAMAERGHAPHHRFADVAPTVALKLLAHPALVAAGCALARLAGAPLTPFQATVLTLAAALPSASSIALLTERFHADTGRVVKIILWSTVLAFGTFSALAGWLHPGAAAG